MDQISDKISQMFDPASNSFWDVLLAGVVLVGSIFAARYARRVIRRRLRAYEGVDEYAGAMIGRIAGWAVVFLGVVFALSVLGVDMVPVVLIIVLFAAFLFLSARSLIENWAAGLLLQSRAPYRPGDRIETLGDTLSGFVVPDFEFPKTMPVFFSLPRLAKSYLKTFREAMAPE